MMLHSYRLPLAVALLALAGAARADYLANVRFSQPSPGALPNSEYVDVTIDYKVDEAGGGVIFARPYTGGVPTPGYAASGGDVVPAGTGTVVQSFRVASGARQVDQVRVFLRSPDLSEVWLEMYLPVCFDYGPDAVYDLVQSHRRDSILKHEQHFSVTLDYASSDAAGCRVFVRPYTDGAPTPGYFASGSAVLPQHGSTTQWFSFHGDADVTHLHLSINDHANTHVLWERDVPCPLQFRELELSNVDFNWPWESNLHNTQNLGAEFTLDHDRPAGVRVWAWCMTGGEPTPGFTFEGGGVEAAGSHTVSRYTRVITGDQPVDGIRLRVFDGGGDILQTIIPIDEHWAPHAIQRIGAPIFAPAAPAILSNGERLEMTFDYRTSAAGNVRIFARPALAGELLYGIASAGSPAYAPPAGSGTFWLTFNSGTHVADSMRFLMTNDDQSVDLLTHFFHGHWAWGSSAVITPVPAEERPPLLASLGAPAPNPFNPAATIPVELAADAAVRLAVFDVRGRLVRTLVDGTLAAGRHEIRFDGTGLASGTYLCRLEAPGSVQTQRLTLVR